MKKVYNYCCKNCWHTWSNKKKFIACPKCKSTNIDIQDDILLAEE